MFIMKSSNEGEDYGNRIQEATHPASSVQTIELIFTWIACVTEHFSSELFTVYIASSIFENHPNADEKTQWVASLNAMNPLSLWISGMLAGYLLDRCKSYRIVLLAHFAINGASILLIGCWENMYLWMLLRLASSSISTETLAPFCVDQVYDTPYRKNAGNLFSTILYTGSTLLANIFLAISPIPYAWPMKFTGLFIIGIGAFLGVFTKLCTSTDYTPSGNAPIEQQSHISNSSDHEVICSESETTQLLPDSRMNEDGTDQTFNYWDFVSHPQWYLLCSFVILRGLLNSIVFLPLNTTFVEYYDLKTDAYNTYKLVQTACSVFFGTVSMGVMTHILKLSIMTQIQIFTFAGVGFFSVFPFVMGRAPFFVVVAIAILFFSCMFCLAALSITHVVAWAKRFPQDQRTFIQSITLSAGQFGIMGGFFLAIMKDWLYLMTIVSAVFMLTISISICIAHQSQEETTDEQELYT